MSPIPIQAWDAKAHEEGESRVIHLDLSKDLGKLQVKKTNSNGTYGHSWLFKLTKLAKLAA